MQSYDNRLDDLLARRGELFEQLRQLEGHLEPPQAGPDAGEECGTGLSMAMVRAKIGDLDAQIAQLQRRA
jgi:hypothetical protein